MQAGDEGLAGVWGRCQRGCVMPLKRAERHCLSRLPARVQIVLLHTSIAAIGLDQSGRTVGLDSTVASEGIQESTLSVDRQVVTP